MKIARPNRISKVERGMWENILQAIFGGWKIIFPIVLGGIITLSITKWQLDSQKKQTQVALMNNLILELEHNKKILNKIESFTGSQPDLPSAWKPAVVNSKYIETDAWKELIKAGVTTNLSTDDIKTFNITNRAIVDVKRNIKTLAANRDRINEWEEFDKANDNPQPTSVKVYLLTAIPEIEQSIKYANQLINESLERLKKIN